MEQRTAPISTTTKKPQKKNRQRYESLSYYRCGVDGCSKLKVDDAAVGVRTRALTVVWPSGSWARLEDTYVEEERAKELPPQG